MIIKEPRPAERERTAVLPGCPAAEARGSKCGGVRGFRALLESFSPLFARSSRWSRPPVSTAGFWEKPHLPTGNSSSSIRPPFCPVCVETPSPKKSPPYLHPSSTGCSQGQFQCEGGTKAKVSWPPKEARGPAGKGLLSFSFSFFHPQKNKFFFKYKTS